MAERTLRERCIDGVIDVLHDHGDTGGGYRQTKDWRDCPQADAHSGTAPKVFDRILGVLIEHADEWIDEEWDRQVARWDGATREDVKRITSKYRLLPLLAVLRSDE